MTGVPEISRDHFSRIVPQWSHFGPPLRPASDDSAAVQRAVSDLSPAAYVVVLGLTPEIIACAWPPEVTLLAVDHSRAMMRSLWPPEKSPANSHALLADWLSIPIRSGAIDLVAGDGCYVLIDFPDGYAALTREVRRVLRPGGRFVIRVFVRPDRSESVAEVARELANGEIGSVHALKLRLLAAVHGASGAGSCLDDVWRAWSDMSKKIPAHLSGVRGWTAEEIVGIDSYRGMQARYFLPTLAEFRNVFRTMFVEIDCTWGRHELANRCPTLVLAAFD